ncbi:helix-turn-helix domain-containing protein [Actinomadura sp. NEAU-AAG7]|uniref:winged helix-turn-helix transcriptional regulator n=1 Tax=Actinomadura sp. NEAU-AAG7 TaxID=2839640 RepID=UPI001BE49276|nr:helix-turn-helix domain-containing protein [Actinomadura sp. NEAU-AAG7]MBT2206832.1 helix-turn-helix transcriptional regulator [Actinomadura sp. NEAU-AAG7]
MTTMTAARRRQEAKAEFDAYMDECPTHRLRGIIGNKWSSMILLRLEDGPRRYADLGRALPGVSAKMLTQTLRSLERDGFVARSVTPTVPVQVEYTLTVLGERLMPLLDAVRQWADRHMGEVDEARAHYDATRT